MAYCTLFDSNYLDKGIVMIDSLIEFDLNCHVYVLCMDDRCKEILDDYYGNKINTISLSVFEDEELLNVKMKRSRGEYCWTCTGKLIKYVLVCCSEYICTYVDSDLCFYSDPQVLITEMIRKKCSVQVVPHRFPPTISGALQEKENGRNCVQFNTFTREKNSLALLEEWIQQCIAECSINTAGDQKYTDAWGDKDFVDVTSNGGAGIAPWNLTRYKLVGDDNSNVVFDRFEKKSYKMVFYHFQGITYIDRYTVRVLPKIQYWVIDDRLHNMLYSDYLLRIEQIKDVLEKKYQISPMISTYIGVSEGKNRTKKEKLIYYSKMPPSVLVMKISEVIRRKLRYKKTVIDVRGLNRG